VSTTEDGWTASTFSGDADADRIQIKAAGGAYAIRDSKSPDGPLLVFTTAAWKSFTAGVHAGEFDF
jgi:hypothetical protein